MTMEDPTKFTSDLTIAISRLTQAQEGWARSFGQLGSAGNTWWTIFARITSGSGLWKLQNRVRAISNVFEAFTKSSDEASKSMIESLESSMGLAQSLKQLNKEIAGGYSKTPLSQMFMADLKSLGKAKGMQQIVDKYTEKIYAAQIKGIEKQQKKRGKKLLKALRPGVGQKFDEFMGNQKMFDGRFGYTGQAARFIGKETKITPALKGIKNLFSGMNEGMVKFAMGDYDENIKSALFGKAYKKGQFMEGGFRTFDADGKRVGKSKMATEDGQRVGFIRKQTLHLEKVGRFIKKGGKILPYLGKFLTMTVAALGKFMMYGLLIVLGITLLAGILKRGWPVMKKQFEGSFKFFKAAFKNIIGIVLGVFKLIKAIFRGDIKAVISIWFNDIFLNIVKLIANVLAGVFKILVGIVGALLAGIWNGIMGIIGGKDGKIFGKRLPMLAQGGLISQGGMAIVGEKGPELVNLPRGARVHSNTESRNMGNTIHVHVNGRVGASDAEIRDIANKVAREINLRMNRTGATRIGA